MEIVLASYLSSGVSSKNAILYQLYMAQPKNPGPFGLMQHCEQSSISVGIICRKKSGRVRSRHFIKRLLALQTSNNIFYKTKVVPFEKLILKSVNKLKSDNF
jgi:hypothetical protein